MLLRSTQQSKSIPILDPGEELPDFVVLSGLNGSGKTHLLAGIFEGFIILSEHEAGLKPIKFVDHNTFAPNDSSPVSRDALRRAPEELAHRYNQYKKAASRTPGVTLETVIGDYRQIRFLQGISDRAGKDINQLSSTDIITHYPLQDVLPTEIFGQNFSSIFKRYHLKQEQNYYNRYRYETRGVGEFLSDGEFIKVNGEPPWAFLNQLLEEANLDYHINTPEGDDPDAPFELVLINNYSGAHINFSDLSSGEKVIMSLALSLYNSKFDMEFPKVLLMDEPDAHLHPSMTKQFLDVIQSLFVDQKQMKVMMTTHSPSTVALAPENSLFIMNKVAPRIEKASKDKALRILTSGVPTLSVQYENRRQVFVESKHDVALYEKLWEKLKDLLEPEISLNFISSGVGGQGNCDQVKEVVNTLAKYGNKTIYGIIDWDTKNSGNEFVKVLGQGRRYSIENYVFDPILLAAFLLREKFVDRDELGVSDSFRYTDFAALEDAELQTIGDFIVNKVRERVVNPDDSDIQDSEYVDGRRVQLPVWFLSIQGHELEDIFKALFPPLNRYRGEGSLAQEIANKVIDDIPGLIPKDVLDLFKEIQNY